MKELRLILEYDSKLKINLSGGAIERDPASAQNFSSLSLVRALAGMKIATESDKFFHHYKFFKGSRMVFPSYPNAHKAIPPKRYFFMRLIFSSITRLSG